MLWGTLFLVGGWLTLTPLNNMAITPVDTLWVDNDTTSTFLVEFSEPMDLTGLLNKNNYSVTNTATGVSLPIYKIGLVKELEDIIITDNKLVAIITKRATYKETYHIVVTGVKDVAGNYIQGNNDDYYWFNALKSETYTPRNVNVQK